VQITIFKMKKITFIFHLVILITGILQAQYKFEHVLPGQSGQALLNNLVTDYKPPVVLDYSTARDTLFFRAFRQNDSLQCFYSGYKLPLPDGYDPTTVVYLNGTENGINTEHSFPQSKGAVGGAKSDMHHLYPTKVNVNESRGNLPYGESPDNQTQKWFYKTIESTSKPLVNIDLYSELNATLFEPREQVKGDVARAIFYFYTMYKVEADDADPTFFTSQKNTLCQWHLLDPVDSFEWRRNEIIAKYQGERKNPYILDCTLPYRTFCPDYIPSCDTTVSTNTIFFSEYFKVYPNPFSENLTICAQVPVESGYSLQISDLIGRIIYTLPINRFDKCIQLKSDILQKLNPGFYILTINADEGNYRNVWSKSLLKK